MLVVSWRTTGEWCEPLVLAARPERGRGLDWLERNQRGRDDLGEDGAEWLVGWLVVGFGGFWWNMSWDYLD